ncbi:hypothetical protein BGX26_007248, partial [Mortierella sp. AD094]
MEERDPSDIAMEQSDDIIDSDNTLTSSRNQSKPPKDKDKASIGTVPTSSRSQSKPPEDKTFVKTVPGATTKENGATLQEFWGSFVP